jgi:hypothetical protein
MWTPEKSRSTRTLRRLGTYLLAQLETLLELAPIHALFQAAETALETKHAAHETASNAVVRSSAARDQKHKAMRLALRTVAHMIRRATANHPGSPLYLKYFPNGVLGVLCGPVAKEIVLVRDIVTKLDTEQDPVLRDQIPLLSTALQEAENALRQYEDAVADERRTRALLEIEKQYWIEGYRATYSRLRIHFGATPERAEDFFRSGPGGRRDNTEEPEQPAQTQPQTIDIQAQAGTLAPSSSSADGAVAEAA